MYKRQAEDLLRSHGYATMICDCRSDVKREEEAAEKELLASLIFCEAGNQPYEGQVAVGAVVMNRRCV